eukprot:1764628-Rhodomonas_salina.2
MKSANLPLPSVPLWYKGLGLQWPRSVNSEQMLVIVRSEHWLIWASWWLLIPAARPLMIACLAMVCVRLPGPWLSPAVVMSLFGMEGNWR